ncbi:RND family efflux transporter, MFP subunit [Desulfosporosinus orientis DSM 765]|uniref:RND family efflux transporter, MFP subunit n=1 Tax=Desulfosporosinus orientis (strain ATCC 19365 / DSM 765 / NCIMB 8382 / VKM B-1628 / Singapore I) TaxID=768706 RepID=G7WH22_DESOD|nr:efflux RND transporter periplasmic adaptor subunit [Desulfosporosinus orientis]AET69530.1 RND family efflux transporter, MFP subunit [Desulfosporosinus orientis DSM 765]
MKRKTMSAALISFVLLASILTGCSSQATDVNPAEVTRPVTVVPISQQSKSVSMKYLGVIGSGELKKYSFKVPGKLAGINVEKGEAVQGRELLAVLDKTDMALALKNSQLNLSQAEQVYADAKDQYAKYQELAKGGAMSQNDLDKAKLDMDVKESNYQKAQVDVEAKQNSLSDTELYADMSGYVTDILYKEGENLAAGYPVIVVRSQEQVIEVGLNQTDAAKTALGTQAEVQVGSYQGEGEVTRIDQVPDSETRTYNTEIKLTKEIPPEAYLIGATADVSLAAGSVNGIWIPISAVMNDGEDYVFVVQDDRAVKKNITLNESQGFNVRVDGLKPGDNLVTSGMKELSEGMKVTVSQAGGQ